MKRDPRRTALMPGDQLRKPLPGRIDVPDRLERLDIDRDARIGFASAHDRGSVTCHNYATIIWTFTEASYSPASPVGRALSQNPCSRIVGRQNCLDRVAPPGPGGSPHLAEANTVAESGAGKRECRALARDRQPRALHGSIAKDA